MPNETIDQSHIEQVIHAEAPRVLATLIRYLHDIDLAEDSLQDAVAAALTQWPRDGIPSNPRTWLISVGRNKGIDAIRVRSRIVPIATDFAATNKFDGDGQQDDLLRLIFMCCHPALDVYDRIALTLREVCQLRTEEVASALLTSTKAMAQRLVRAKAALRSANVTFETPGPDSIIERFDSVLAVIYLVFNQGYYASQGESVIRHDLSREAIRLARMVLELHPTSEVHGLLAMMLFNESRQPARTDDIGDIITLEFQDRTLWDASLIADADQHLEVAWASNEVGPYTLLAAIAKTHSVAQSSEDTDWNQIIHLYDALLATTPNYIIALNRAVAVSMANGPAEGLKILEHRFKRPDIQGYCMAHAAHGNFLSQLDRMAEAKTAYERALALSTQEPERRFLARRIAQVAGEL